MLKKAILTIAGAAAVAALAVPAASASTGGGITAAHSGWGSDCFSLRANCLVITQATTTPGLKYQADGPPVHYHV